MSLEKKRK